MKIDNLYHRVAAWPDGPERDVVLWTIALYDRIAGGLRVVTAPVVERFRSAFGAAPDGWDTPRGLATLRKLVESQHASAQVAQVLRAETREQLIAGTSALDEATRAMAVIAPYVRPADPDESLILPLDQVVVPCEPRPVPVPAIDLTPLFQEPTP